MNFTQISLISLIAGFAIGAFAQSSRMCFIGGWRDFFLIRDNYLLKGFFTFLFTAAILFFVFSQLGFYLKDYPWYDREVTYAATDMMWLTASENNDYYRDMEYCELMMMPAVTVGDEVAVPSYTIGDISISHEIVMYIVAAFIIGFFSTIANGCPLRQHVLASSGDASSMVYLLGFYIAIVFYDLFFAEVLNNYVNFPATFN